jgi:predicted porin
MDKLSETNSTITFYHSMIYTSGATMKNLLLPAAISLALASGTVNAVTIYEKEGFQFKIDGDIQVQLRQNTGVNQDTGIDFDDSEIKNKVIYDLGDGMTAFAESHFDTKKSSSEETFVGLGSEAFTVTLGNTNYATDDFATERGIEEPGSVNAFDNGMGNGVDGDIIRFDFNVGAVSIAISHDPDETATTTPTSTDIFASTELGAITLGLAHQNHRANDAAQDVSSSGVSFAFEAGKFDLAADYSKVGSGATGNLQGLKVANLSLGFPLSPSLTGVVGITNESNDNNTVEDSWYANVTYKFPKANKVSAFAEIQDDGVDTNDVGVLAGLRVKF